MQAKSPLREMPLRNPGQSLDEEMSRVLNDAVLTNAVFTSGFVVLAIVEWVGFLTDSPRFPYLFTGCALIVIAIAAFKFRRLIPHVRRLKQGRDGERLVGQLLSDQKMAGARVFHDVPGDGFNLDHVVISDRGILVVETKTYAKPYGRAKISFEGNELLVAGRKPERDLLAQARGQTTWLRELLRASTSKDYPVRAALVFPGWWIDPAPDVVRRDVWVLEPKALRKYVEREPIRLTLEDVSMAGFHLEQYVRMKMAYASAIG